MEDSISGTAFDASIAKEKATSFTAVGRLAAALPGSARPAPLVVPRANLTTLRDLGLSDQTIAAYLKRWHLR